MGNYLKNRVLDIIDILKLTYYKVRLKNMERPKVSIIMPVYNVEKYLEKAIDSIIGQTYENWELICVDDGSTDMSLSILNKFSERDSRINVLTQTNMFAGAARNKGMKKATGKYIMFLDSDDLFRRKMLESLVALSEFEKTEVVICGHYFYDNNTLEKEKSNLKIRKHCLYSGESLKDVLFQVVYGVPWNKLFLLEKVKEIGIKYQEIRNNNDEYFNKIMISQCGKVRFCNVGFIDYRINNSSSLQGSVQKNMNCIVMALKAIYDELNDRMSYELYKKSFNRFLISMCIDALNRCGSIVDYLELCKFIDKELIDILDFNDTQIFSEKYNRLLFEKIKEKKYEESIICLLKFNQASSISKQSMEVLIGTKMLRYLKLLK